MDIMEFASKIDNDVKVRENALLAREQVIVADEKELAKKKKDLVAREKDTLVKESLIKDLIAQNKTIEARILTAKEIENARVDIGSREQRLKDAQKKLMEDQNDVKVAQADLTKRELALVQRTKEYKKKVEQEVVSGVLTKFVKAA